MAMTKLEKAEKLLSARRFSEVVRLLEPLIREYKDSFTFFYILGTACLYLSDIGGADLYYKEARKIKMTDAKLITAQAVLFLRRGEVNRAVQYYLEAQEYDPYNKLAKNALEFIKVNGKAEVFIHLVETGGIKRFYPSLGLNPVKVRAISLISIVVLACVSAYFMFFTVDTATTGKRADLSDFVLSVEEKSDALIQDTASSVFRYILTQSELEKAYADAQVHFQSYRDNLAQVEINKILNSNASASIRQKARLLAEYFEEPTFDSDIVEFSYEDVKDDVWLYLDTWVTWSGRITNVSETATEFRCDFLIGYDTLQKVEGFVPLVISQPVSIDSALPVQVLAQISVEDGRLLLKGKSIYQPLVGKE